MAGIISSCFLFNPSSSTTTTNNASSASKLYLSSSSFTPVFHAKIIDSPRRRIGCMSSAAVPLVVLARHGGRFHRRSRPKRSSGRDKRLVATADPDDEALNISRITSISVRLIDEQQNMVGITSIDEALRMAEDAERDLVILSEDADPPVLKIMDYNKYKYEQQKRKRDHQKKSVATRMDNKELKMGYNIDSHDYSVRLKAAQKFLKDGDKVKIIIIIDVKRQEDEFRNIAIELLKRFQNDLGELATEEVKNFSNKNPFIVLIPNKTTIQKSQEQPKKKEGATDKQSASV